MRIAASQRHRHCLAAAVSALAGGLIFGCEGVPEAGRQMLLNANDAYDRGEYAAAEQSVGTFLADFGSSPAAAEARYLRGLCRMRLEQRDAARADFAAAASGTRRDDLRARCKAMLGNLAYEDGNVEHALAYYIEAEPNLPARSPTDEILYRYAESLQRVGRWKEAKLRLSRLLHQFPDSPHAAAARRRFSWPYDYFAIRCGVYGRVDEANRAAAELQRKGMTAKPEFIAVDERADWLLLTGQYATYDRAVADLARVRQIVPAAIIVP